MVVGLYDARIGSYAVSETSAEFTQEVLMISILFRRSGLDLQRRLAPNSLRWSNSKTNLEGDGSGIGICEPQCFRDFAVEWACEYEFGCLSYNSKCLRRKPSSEGSRSTDMVEEPAVARC